MDDRYRTALLDWLGCAMRGAREPAARAARAVGDGAVERAAWLGTAGHVLDFDDTYLPGLAHLSAPTAPAAIALGAEVGATVGDVLVAYAAGFEAMGAIARASHPALYEGGWHPTAVCGAPGAATAAAALLGLDAERIGHAQRLALTQAGGMRAAFGSDAKSLQVGMAAAAGVLAARAAGGGANASPDIAGGRDGFDDVHGGTWAEPPDARAIDENWIKPWPCCLMAHSAIEAALTSDDVAGAITVRVHPTARSAAAYDDVADGLQAKFSIPYLVASTLRHGAPTVDTFDGVDAAVRAASRRIAVKTDPALGEAEAVLLVDGAARARVVHALGSPARPMDPGALRDKFSRLAGTRLAGILDDPGRPAADLLAAVAGNAR